MKQDFKLLEQRDAELYKDYLTTRKKWEKEKRKYTQKQLIEYVITNCHPRYHFTFEYSRRMVHNVMKSPSLPHKPTLHQALWYEIAGKVEQIIKRHPSKSQTEALCEVLAFERASCYFLSYQYAKRIIYEQTRPNSTRHRA